MSVCYNLDVQNQPSRCGYSHHFISGTLITSVQFNSTCIVFNHIQTSKSSWGVKNRNVKCRRNMFSCSRFAEIPPSVALRWFWCSPVQEPCPFKTWCSACPSDSTLVVSPESKGWNATRWEEPLRRRRPPVKLTVQSRCPSTRWSSSTAHGTRPARSARTRGCRVISSEVVRAAGVWCHCAPRFSLHHVPAFFPRSTAGGAQDEENLFLAPSKGETRQLPGHHWGHLLFPQGFPPAMPCSRVQWGIWQPALLLLLPAFSGDQGQNICWKVLNGETVDSCSKRSSMAPPAIESFHDSDALINWYFVLNWSRCSSFAKDAVQSRVSTRAVGWVTCSREDSFYWVQAAF